MKEGWCPTGSGFWLDLEMVNDTDLRLLGGERQESRMDYGSGNQLSIVDGTLGSGWS
jgi:hypothetical protein